MRLLVISETPHALDNGQWKGWAATVRELSALATLFDELVHVTPVGSPLTPALCAYGAPNVRVVGVRPTGGRGWKAKAGILAGWADYLKVILRELKSADAVHVRCPCNIGLLTILLLCVIREPRRRWIKYAGNWRPKGQEPWSYRLQRWLLRKTWHRGLVTVNGQWEGDPDHILEFFNPSFSESELAEARLWGKRKVLDGVIRCVFVGRVEEAKGAGRAVEIVNRLRQQGVEAELDLVGDGPLLRELMRAGNRWVKFHGWLPRDEIRSVWQKAHICLLPSDTEGWPKAISEAMAWGVVPVASSVGSVPHYLNQFGCGMALPARDVEGFTEAIEGYVRKPDRWKHESERAMEAAHLFTYEAHVRRVRDLLAC